MLRCACELLRDEAACASFRRVDTQVVVGDSLASRRGQRQKRTEAEVAVCPCSSASLCVVSRSDTEHAAPRRHSHEAGVQFHTVAGLSPHQEARVFHLLVSWTAVLLLHGLALAAKRICVHASSNDFVFERALVGTRSFCDVCMRSGHSEGARRGGSGDALFCHVPQFARSRGVAARSEVSRHGRLLHASSWNSSTLGVVAGMLWSRWVCLLIVE